jgi:hypothetical protein
LQKQQKKLKKPPKLQPLHKLHRLLLKLNYVKLKKNAELLRKKLDLN